MNKRKKKDEEKKKAEEEERRRDAEESVDRSVDAIDKSNMEEIIEEKPE